MIGAFKTGAEAKGHQVDVVDVCRKNIHGCLACEYCHTKGEGKCIQKDDMYDAAKFSYDGDFVGYLGLESLGIFTTHGYDPGVPEEKLNALREFGSGL